MAHVVFLRAANVGGHNVFHPAKLVAALSHLDVVNIGAVGTFVVRGRATAAAIRREILSRLSFEPDIVIRPARAIRSLVDSKPFRGVSFSKDLRGWAAALTGKPKSLPALPLSAPDGRDWSVRIDRVADGFALGLTRRTARPIFPNGFVEKVLGVPATTRYWETFERLASVLEARA